MGTPNYMAPEVASFRRYDRKADIYNFGVMLWEMWYGKRAFHGISPKDLQEQVAQTTWRTVLHKHETSLTIHEVQGSNKGI